MIEEKNLSNPFSTGGGGGNFEHHVQAAYALLMLSGGFAPALRVTWPIVKIKLQGRHEEFSTDDLIVFVKDPTSEKEARLLAQVKHSISITKGDAIFATVIRGMWVDFNNPSLFDPSTDAMAIITGPMNKTDIENVSTILEWARESESAVDFLNRVNKAKFSSREKQDKLAVLRFHLDKAKGSPLTDEELWRFLRSFCLMGYDLDMKRGVVQSLLQSIIGVYSPTNVTGLWAQLVDEIGYSNQSAGVLTKDTFSPEITAAFEKKEVKTIPSELVSKIEEEAEADVEERFLTSGVAPVFLIGAWDERLEDDKKTVEKIADSPYRKWITPIQTFGSRPNPIIEYKNRKWKFKNRSAQWKRFAPFLYDDHLDRFRQIAATVLTEKDPKFELPKEQRYAASIYGKNRIFSKALVYGIAEGAALMGTFPASLTSCSPNKAEDTIALLVREILSSDDWAVWASLNDYLPLLAEASPTAFLDEVGKKLDDANNTLFQSIFSQESSGIGGWNYISGLLWALECLAWSPEHMPRAVLLLGQLAELDPGGSWANRPINSLTTIFMPWLPQTTADFPKRKAAMEALLIECPRIGWKVLLSILPKAHQVSSGSYTPKLRDFIPSEHREKPLSEARKVPAKEYLQQTEYYSNLAVEAVKKDLGRLKELVSNVPSLPPSALGKLVEYLTSAEILGLPDDQKVDMWEKLADTVLKHRKFSGANWTLPPAIVQMLAAATESLKPSSPMLIHHRLFGQYDLYPEKGDFERQAQEVAVQRTNAIKEISESLGIDGVLEFAKTARYASDVGQALGRIEGKDFDPFLFPDKLVSSDKVITEVVRGYVWARFHILGWSWVDKIETAHWSDEQKTRLLVFLPFTDETWKRATTMLGAKEDLYWNSADANPYQLKDDPAKAVKQLLKFGRPKAAIACLTWMLHLKVEPSVDDICAALLACPSSHESQDMLDHNAMTELIEWLQGRTDVDLEVLAKIEWLFLPLLDDLLGKRPKTLEQKLAEEPEFFCEVIRTVFRSEKEKEEATSISEERKNVATQAYTLLFQWKTPPGTRLDGALDVARLNGWIKDVRLSCEESGHLSIALDQIGKVFAHAPADPNGLWIHRAVAGHLDAKDSDVMREAFNVEIFNMRGTHGWTAGEEEKGIAARWRERADTVEKEGFIRFAASLREIADRYEHEARRDSSGHPFDD